METLYSLEKLKEAFQEELENQKKLSIFGNPYEVDNFDNLEIIEQ